MSPKECSLAVQEVKEGVHDYVELDFVPELKVLCNQRINKDSVTTTDLETIKISGRITVSF